MDFTRCKKISFVLENGEVYELTGVTSLALSTSVPYEGTQEWELTASGAEGSTVTFGFSEVLLGSIAISPELVKDKEVEWGIF